MGSFLLLAILVLDLLLKVSGNAEGDALNALKANLADPNNVLQNWDPTQVSPCTWFRVTCNSNNSVTRVDLGDENLSGQLVPQLGQLPNLQYLELYSNNITGKIPDELGNLTNLVSLDLYLNGLTGSIPDTFGNLKKLRFLRLNNNSLSGKIPTSLTTVASLQVLDFSNNRLKGEIPVNGSFSLIPSISFQSNPGLKQLKFPPTPPISPAQPAYSAIAGVVAAGAALLFAAPAIVLAYWRRRKQQDHYFDVPAEEDPYEIHRRQLKKFSLFQLQVATANFSEENIVGRGGFGNVYKGFLPDGSLVALKRLEPELTQVEEPQFLSEVKIISMAAHRNLLPLLDRPETQPPLDWQTRKGIALGAARGLAYLHDHCDMKIIHRDVKPLNILLDEEFEAVVGDFGLAKLMDYKDTYVTTSAIGGTLGFMAPEYMITGMVSEKTDVFGYGIVLLEIITGQRAFNPAQFLSSGGDAMLLHQAKGLLKDKRLETLVDPDLQGNYDEEEVEQLTQLALLCTIESPMVRPKMSGVVRMLEDGDGVAEKWEKWEKGMLQQDLNYTHNSLSFYWKEDSLSHILAEELSGPR